MNRLRNWGAAGGIRLMLGLQVGIGAMLLVGDMLGAGIFTPRPTPAPSMEQPVRPGDQTRRFEPRTTPFQWPGSSTMPRRLQLETQGDRLHLLGQIAPGDAERFAAHLDGMEAPPRQLSLFSPGGSVADALDIGRRVRAEGMTTTVQDGNICLSACPYILAAGTSRSAGPEAMVGVHQHYFGENTLLPAFIAVEDIQRGQGELMQYLDEMGIDLRLMQPALMTPPHEIYVLVEEEMERYGLITPE